MASLARDTHEIIGGPFGFPFPFQRGPKTGILLKLQDIQAGLRSWDGGMLQTLLLALSVPLLPAPLIAPQSSCPEAKLEKGGPAQRLCNFWQRSFLSPSKEYVNAA